MYHNSGMYERTDKQYNKLYEFEDITFTAYREDNGLCHRMLEVPASI